MDIFQLARDHYNSIRSQALGKFEVPQWKDSEGNIPVIYVRSMNLSEDSERTNFALAKDLLGYNVHTIIFCACDENMKPIFKKSDAQFISNQMCSKVLGYIVGEIATILDREVTGDLEPEKKN